MSFNNTKTPTKPTCKAKYQVPQRKHARAGVMEFYLTPELEKEFRRLFPVTMNRRMMELFGISFSTLQRFKRELGLVKNETTIRKKLAKQVKKICEDNGYYDSLRGKAPSDACIEATKKMWAEGFHPMKALKKKSPRKYKRTCQRRSEERKALIAKEKKHIRWGLSQSTGLHLPFDIFTRSQVSHRHNALKRGYLLGDMAEFSGERYTIFYDKDTKRSPRFEQNCINDGFRFQSV